MIPDNAGIEIDVKLQPLPEISALESDWESVYGRSRASYFTSWGWIGTWISALPATVSPQLLVARHAGATVGLAVVVARHFRRHFVVRSRGFYLHETGDPALDHALTIEHNGFVACQDMERDVAHAFIRYLSRQTQGWDELFLSGISHGIPFQGITECFGSPARLEVTRTRPYYYVDLAALRERGADYLSVLNSNTRQQLRRALRKYEQSGPLAIVEPGTTDEALKFLDDLEALHQDNWTQRGEPGAFASPYFRNFHRRLITTRFSRGEVQLLRITVGEKTIGYLYNFVLNGRVYAYQNGFCYDADPVLKPGYVSHFLAIQHNLARGASVYDFLAGDMRYKKSLSDQSGEMQWMVVRREKLMFSIERWLRRLKQNYMASRARDVQGAKRVSAVNPEKP